MCKKIPEIKKYKLKENNFLKNWMRSNEPFSSKVKLAIKNNLIKIKRGKTCCGNYGEVGC